MRVSRKAGLRIPRKTITLTGGRSERAYCTIDGVSHNSGAEDIQLSLPVGTVITLSAIGSSIIQNQEEKTAVLAVNGWPIRSGNGALELRYVVTDDATIEFGYDESYDYSIGVAETEEKTIRFYVDAGGAGTAYPESAYIAKGRMTWENWCNNKKYQQQPGSSAGSLSVKGFAAGNSGVSFCCGDTSLAKPVYTEYGEPVMAADEILDGHTYVVAME